MLSFFHVRSDPGFLFAASRHLAALRHPFLSGLRLRFWSSCLRFAPHRRALSSSYCVWLLLLTVCLCVHHLSEHLVWICSLTFLSFNELAIVLVFVIIVLGNVLFFFRWRNHCPHILDQIPQSRSLVFFVVVVVVVVIIIVVFFVLIVLILFELVVVVVILLFLFFCILRLLITGTIRYTIRLDFLRGMCAFGPGNRWSVHTLCPPRTLPTPGDASQ